VSDIQTSFVSDVRRTPRTREEQALIGELQLYFAVYDFTATDRVSIARAVIAALDAAEAIGAKK
jgi:hypothetical protein